MAVLLNDVCYSAMAEFRCTNSRILSVKFRFARVKVCAVI